MLCIGFENLKIANLYEGYANQKKIGYPDLLAGQPKSTDYEICGFASETLIDKY